MQAGRTPAAVDNRTTKTQRHESGRATGCGRCLHRADTQMPLGRGGRPARPAVKAAEGVFGATVAGAADVVVEAPASLRDTDGGVSLPPAVAAAAAAGDAGAVDDASGVPTPEEEKPGTEQRASPSCKGSSDGALFFIWASLASSAAIWAEALDEMEERLTVSTDVTRYQSPRSEVQTLAASCQSS